MKNFWIVVLIIILAVAVWWLWPKGEAVMVTPEADVMISPTQEATDGAMMEKVSRIVTLAETQDSGQTGTAVFTSEGAKTRVELTMAGEPYATPQPAHIHIGTCPTPGEVKYPLTSVVTGGSVTILDVPFEVLFGQEALAVNVHKSVLEASVYTACGNLTL